ncbi:MAG: hypothetical protein ACXWSC_18585, partial [Bdellovibrionota bacterium]
MKKPQKKSRPGLTRGKRPSSSDRRVGRPGPAMNFRVAFDALWRKLFTSLVHLDSALSQAPPSVKSTLAPIARLLLQRPSSLAHFLRFQLSEDEPWFLDAETLAEWPTAREMAKRLQQSYER